MLTTTHQENSITHLKLALKSLARDLPVLKQTIQGPMSELEHANIQKLINQAQIIHLLAENILSKTMEIHL